MVPVFVTFAVTLSKAERSSVPLLVIVPERVEPFAKVSVDPASIVASFRIEPERNLIKPLT